MRKPLSKTLSNIDNSAFFDIIGNMKQVMLIIDPQNDFCDPQGALAVSNAAADCERLAAFINRNTEKIDSIFVTMDTHHLFHIANPLFWLTKEGAPPEPFTIITAQAIRENLFKAANSAYQKHALSYVETLEKENRYQLCIWPPHCLEGSWGHGVFPVVFNAICDWEKAAPGRITEFIQKGGNPKTEHYSAIRAEVPDPLDPNSTENVGLLKKLKTADTIYIAGQALSHCVANTVRDLLKVLPSEKLIILEDTTSNVTGFERVGEEFLKEAQRHGVRCIRSEDGLLG